MCQKPQLAIARRDFKAAHDRVLATDPESVGYFVDARRTATVGGYVIDQCGPSIERANRHETSAGRESTVILLRTRLQRPQIFLWCGPEICAVVRANKGFFATVIGRSK